MTKLYALFSNTLGDGGKSTFICSMKETDVVPKQIGSTWFFRAECEVSDDYYDADTRKWYVPEWSHLPGDQPYLVCIGFPRFNN